MINGKNLLWFLFCITIIYVNCKEKESFPVLRGDYLGQKPPGMTPELFAPGIISTGFDERIAAFSPDGKELYYALWGAPHGVILHMREVNGRWTKPKVAPFSGRYQGDFTMSADGNRIVFSSNSPFAGAGKPQNDYYSWIVERTENSWGKPQPFGPLINSPESFAGCPTIADNGNLYFFSDRSGCIGSEDIWMSRFVNGNYEKPQNLGESINTEDYDLDPFIAPDESYILFVRIDKQRKGDADLFIGFRRGDGTWTKAINMGDRINSKDWELCPTVSPDGKYLFFTSTRRIYKSYSEIPLSYERKLEILNSPGNGSEDIYWVDAKIIEELKPDEVNR
jgi:Tol biopolymer transport system component